MIHRNVSRYLQSCMRDYFSVAVFGPRQCGKTTLVRELYPDFSYANLEDMNTRALAKNDPDEFFTRFPEPVIIDEIQRVPELLSAVQVRIDKNRKRGQYILTGSQQIPLKNSVSQSLAGRIAIVQMQPLSMRELTASGIELDRDTQLVSGCMPFLFSEKGRKPFEYYRNYVQTYLEKDIAQVGAVHDLLRFENFLRLLAGRTGQLVNNSALAVEVGVSSTTVGSWLSILEASHLVYILRPWYASRTSQVVKTPKVYFCDTGLASYLLGIETPGQMQRDPLLGSLFENLVVSEALKARYDSGAEPDLYFFRNSKGLEIDLILKTNRSLRLFEVKSGKSLNDEFTRNMRKFREQYASHVSHAGDSPVLGTVIYSGETYASYKDFAYSNYRETGSLFEPEEEPFALDF
ncbi:MAG: ATP-binding protein [Treponemataceae bacterium]|nr:ATP-binding protein [Treponemataceae bacterium]